MPYYRAMQLVWIDMLPLYSSGSGSGSGGLVYQTGRLPVLLIQAEILIFFLITYVPFSL